MHSHHKLPWLLICLCLTACTDEQQEQIAAESEKTAERLGAAADKAKTALSEAARRVLKEFDLDVSELRKELEERGEVVRRRVEDAAREVETVVEDAVVASKVKLRLVQDPEVPSMVINVRAEGGHVKLTGRVASLEQVQRALVATLEVEEVRAVTCSLTVEPDDGTDATKH